MMLNVRFVVLMLGGKYRNLGHCQIGQIQLPALALCGG